MSVERVYSRVYHEIETHPRFEHVFRRDALLALWLRMLITSDRYWPESAPMPARTRTVRELIDAGLVIEEPGNRYRMRGQWEERERRSNAGRNAAAIRWRNAGASGPNMPRREEKRREGASHNGGTVDKPITAPPAPGERPALKHYGQHPGCVVCAPLRKAESREARKPGRSV